MVHAKLELENLEVCGLEKTLKAGLETKPKPFQSII